MTALPPAPSVALVDVKWRVDGRPTDDKKSVRYVPYMDAVTVARLLDEWVGPFNWKDDYSAAPGKGLYCHLSVRGVFDLATGHSDWVTKTDIGVPSNFEGEKGEVSDAFKRTATIKWGIGRNVYRLPMPMWAPCRVDAKGNAWPTDATIPEIIKKLKAAGVEDADAAEATAVHDSDDIDCPHCGEPIEGAKSDREPMRSHLVAAHDYVRNEDGSVQKPKPAEEAS